MTDTGQYGLSALLDRYESDGSNAVRRLLHQRAANGGETFLAEARATLIERPVSDGLKFALTLLDREEILRIILAIYLQSKEEAIALARKLLSCDPRFDSALLDYVREERIAERSENSLLVLLDILDDVSEGEKLVLNVSRLLRHPSAKLRSKAASFIARRKPNLPWIADLSNESDARVRANVVESLHEIQADFVLPLLWKHADDENNRVSGNALVGLYRMGEARCLALIDKMSKDQRALFRATSAWVMGQTGDVRFATTLAALLCDTDARVRQQALRSLGRIKEALKDVPSGNALHVAVLKRQTVDGVHSLLAAISSDSGDCVPNIPGTRFIVKTGGKYLRQYEVREQTMQAAMHVAFVACLPAAGADLVSGECEKALELCSAARRGTDVLTLSTLSYDAQLRCVQDDAASAAAAVRDALVHVAFGFPNLHLIVIGACTGTHVLEALLAATAGSDNKVHVLALTPEWRTGSIRTQVEDRGGYVIESQKLDDLSQVCRQFYSALQHHYALTWPSSESDIELEVRSEQGVGSALCRDCHHDSACDTGSDEN